MVDISAEAPKTVGQRTRSKMHALPVSDLYNEPATVSLVRAGAYFGYGERLSRKLAQAGEFPVAVLKRGLAYRITRASLIALLDPAGTGRPPQVERVQESA